MIVKIHSIFSASVDEIFKKLQEVGTLQYIASPYASFIPENNKSMWCVGDINNYNLKIFGFLPMGSHTIKVIKFNKKEVYTNEHNKYVKVWNHKIILNALNETQTHYTDEVELKAGIYTVFIWFWAILFYNHRQNRWKKLLKNI